MNFINTRVSKIQRGLYKVVVETHAGNLDLGFHHTEVIANEVARLFRVWNSYNLPEAILALAKEQIKEKS